LPRRDQMRHQLKSCDLHALSSFLQDLYAALDPAGVGSAVVCGLRRLVPADRCSFNYIDPIANQAAWVAHGSEYPMNERVFAAHIRKHPILIHVRRTGDGGCLRLSDHTTRQAFHRSELYNDWYRPLGTEHQLMTVFLGARKRFVAAALSRSGRPDFS